jgi:Cytochrome c oxidase subunit IV
MNLFSRIIFGFGGFLLVTGVIYGAVTYEWEGTTLMLIVAGGALLVGAYLVSAVHRARVALAAEAAAVPLGGPDAEPHVGPTIWPLVIALATIGLVVGAVGPLWALVGGGALFIAAGIGWILDVRQQWRHHDEAEPHEESPDLAGGPHHA